MRPSCFFTIQRSLANLRLEEKTVGSLCKVKLLLPWVNREQDEDDSIIYCHFWQVPVVWENFNVARQCFILNGTVKHISLKIGRTRLFVFSFLLSFFWVTECKRNKIETRHHGASQGTQKTEAICWTASGQITGEKV